MTRPIFYIATPYSQYAQGREQAWRDACAAAATLIKRGLFVFSPVAHSHPIAEFGDIDPLCHKTWMPLDLAMLDECAGLVVVMMPGWRESIGVQREIAHAIETDKSVCYLSWPMLNVRENVEGVRDLLPGS